MKKLLFYIIMAMLLLAGCNSTDKIDRTLTQADSIMENDQEKALTSIKILDGIKSQLSEMSKGQRMRYYLLYSKAMNKGDVKFSSDSIMKKVTDYYDHHGSDEDKLMSHYLLGCVYRDMGDAPFAIKKLDEAITFAGKNKYSYLMLAHIHGQIADLMDGQALVRQELYERNLSAQYDMLAEDTVDAITALNLRASAYALINEIDSSIILNDSAIKMFKKMGYIKYAAQISGQSIDFNVYKRNFKKAKNRMDFHEKYSGYFNKGNIESGREVYYYWKGLYYLGVNKNDSANFFFRKCLKFKGDLNLAVAGYHGLSLLYQNMNKPDSTAKYAMLAYDANDSCYQAETAEELLRQQSLYNYSRHQDVARQSAEQTASLQRWLFGTFVLVVILVCSTLLIFRRKKLAVQKKMALMRNRYETEKTLLQREMEEMYALLEERQSLLESKDEQLERKKNELNGEIGKREQYITELQERVAQYERDLNVKDIAIQEDDIQSASIRSDFEYFITHVKEHPSNRRWNALASFAKTKLPKLFMMLNNYNVSQHEFRICILVRLKFKPGEIATIMNCRFPEVSLTRSRLLKRIYGIENGKAADFDKRVMLMY